MAKIAKADAKEETYETRTNRLRREMEACGGLNANVILTFKPGATMMGIIGSIPVPRTRMLAQIAKVDYGQVFFVARNARSDLSISTSTSIWNVERIEKDPAKYEVFYLTGGGHGE